MMTRPSDTWHRLTDINGDDKTATCSVDGPVAVRPMSWNVDGTRKWHCGTRVNERYAAKSTEDRRRQSWEQHLYSRYRMRSEDFAWMLLSQDFQCPLCERELDQEDVHIDHDHACCSGAYSCGACVRGLLCGMCNKGLGHFRDEAATLRRAAEWVS